MKTTLLLAAAAALLAGCQSVPSDAPKATANLEPTKGNKAMGAGWSPARSTASISTKPATAARATA